MSENNNTQEGSMNETTARTLERLREEITILRIEGTLFCFDPAEAKQRRGIITNMLRDSDGTERPVSVHIHPDFGQPSVLAYKIAQTIFLKMTEAGDPYPNVIGFTQRELARLVGRTWSGVTSRQLYTAMMQLQNSRIICSVHNKETKEYFEVSFNFLVTTMFSSKDKSINECVVQMHDAIVASLNRNHAIWLNYDRLRTLDTIGMVLYKRLFFHLSNTYQTNTRRSTFKFEKDYEDICREWLGGLKPERYKSRIEKQLGRYLDSVKATGLLSRYQIAERVRGSGYKIVFYPVEAFYQDYIDFYVRSPREKRTDTLPSSDPQPLQLVAYFHQLMGHPHNNFAAKEREQAAEIIKLYGFKEGKEFVEHVVKEAATTSYKMKFFGALLAESYRASYEVQRTKANCPICHGRGWIEISDRSGVRVMQCTHSRQISA